MTAVIEELDPRIRRTRQMLHQAFKELLEEKMLQDISVQDIAERSTVNRATFYDHFPDKFALLEDLIDTSFRAFFEKRMEGGVASCPEAMKRLILAVCDFLADISVRCQKQQRQFEPLLETKIKSIVRDFILKGQASKADGELRATAATWAICGAALEWSRTRATPPEALAEALMPMITPVLFDGTAGPHPG